MVLAAYHVCCFIGSIIMQGRAGHKIFLARGTPKGTGTTTPCLQVMSLNFFSFSLQIIEPFHGKVFMEKAYMQLILTGPGRRGFNTRWGYIFLNVNATTARCG